MKWISITATLAVLVQTACGQSTIAWFPRPAPEIVNFPAFGDTDVNADGAPDIRFTVGDSICTTDVPTSFCWTSFPIIALGANQIATFQSDVSLFPQGTLIGESGATNGTWSAPETPVKLTGTIWRLDKSTGTSSSIWTDPLASQPNSYFGVRLQMADGVHYGWVHVVLLEISPVFTDWAFETRPNTAIVAGAKPVIAPMTSPQIVRAGNLRLRWQSEDGKAYQVQSKESLTAPLWTNLNFSAIGSVSNSAVDVPITGTTKFFRVVEAD